MTKSEKEFMDRQFAKANAACAATVKKNQCVKQLEVLTKAKFWPTWASTNGYSHLVKKTHRFVAVLKLQFLGRGEMCFSVSNPDQPEIAVLDVIKMAMAGWTPVPCSSNLDVFKDYAKTAKANFKAVKKVLDDYVKAMEA